MCVCVFVCVRVSVCVCLRVSVGLYGHVCVSVSLCVHDWVCLRVCVRDCGTKTTITKNNKNQCASVRLWFHPFFWSSKESKPSVNNNNNKMRPVCWKWTLESWEDTTVSTHTTLCLALCLRLYEESRTVWHSIRDVTDQPFSAFTGNREWTNMAAPYEKFKF